MDHTYFDKVVAFQTHHLFTPRKLLASGHIRSEANPSLLTLDMTSSPARCRCESFSGVLHLVSQLRTCRLSTPTTPKGPHPVELYWRLNQKSELPPKEATSTPNNFNFVERSASANLASASRVGPTKRRPTKRRLPCDLFVRSKNV